MHGPFIDEGYIGLIRIIGAELRLRPRGSSSYRLQLKNFLKTREKEYTNLLPLSIPSGIRKSDIVSRYLISYPIDIIEMIEVQVDVRLG